MSTSAALFYESDGECNYTEDPGPEVLKCWKEIFILRNSWCHKCELGYESSSQLITHTKKVHPDDCEAKESEHLSTTKHYKSSKSGEKSQCRESGVTLNNAEEAEPDGEQVFINPENPDNPIKSETEVLSKFNSTLEDVAMNPKSADIVDLTNSDEEENRDISSDSQLPLKPSSAVVEDPDTLCSPSGSEISTDTLILEHLPPQQNDQLINNEPESGSFNQQHSMNSLEINIGQYSLAEQYNGYNPISPEEDVEVDIEEGELEIVEEESMPNIEFTSATATNKRRKRRRRVPMSYSGRNTGKSDSTNRSRTESYAERERIEAMRGNPAFDYRTRINEVTGHEQYAIYKCLKCPTGFPRMHHLKIHQKNHGKGAARAYACELGCDFSTLNSRLLTLHHKRHQLQNDPSRFESMELHRRKKRQSNKDEKSIPSEVSSNSGDDEEIPNSGIKMNGQTKRRKSSHAELNKNSEANLGKKPKVVEDPKKVGPRRKSAIVDYQEQMDTTSDTESIDTSQDVSYNGDRYDCWECSYVTSNLNSWKRHIGGHTEQKKYRCSFCNFSSSAQKNLEKHEKIHPKEMKLKVPKLKIKLDSKNKEKKKQKRIAAADATPLEQMRRQKLKNLQCSKCPSRFSGSTNLNIHLRQHGAYGRKYQCEICDYTSNRDDYIKSHQLVHMGNHQNLDNEDEEVFENENNVNEEDASLNDTSVASSSAAAHSQSEAESSDDDWDKPPPSVQVTIRKTPTPPSSDDDWDKPPPSVQGTIRKTPTPPMEQNGSQSSTSSIRASNSSSVGCQDQEDGEDSNWDEEPAKVGKYFITSLKIANILPIDQREDTDLSKSGLVKLRGNTEEGKSSFIAAVMLGFGYDLFQGISERTVCGLDLQNIISKSKDFATIELVLSLHAYPDLQKEFGTHVKIQRRLTRENDWDWNQLSIDFSITPMPNGPNSTANVSKFNVLTVCEFKGFLKKIKLSPEKLRLMLMDGENITYMMENQQLWYSFFEAALMDDKEILELKLKEVEFLLNQVEDDERSKRERIRALQLRHIVPLPIETEQTLKFKERNLRELNVCKLHLAAIIQERQKLKNKKESYLFQLNNRTEIYDKMQLLFNKFLNKVDYKGFIVVDEELKVLRICVQKLDSKEPAPESLDDVNNIWKFMSIGKRRLAMIGLYMGLWDISNSLPFFAADAYSCMDTEFKVPSAGIPILYELVKKKCLEQKQSIISFPPEY